MKYHILWIDDQHDKLPAIHKTAKDFNIELHPFHSMNGGCGDLEKNPEKYDAILLDAKIFENEDDQPGTEDTKWVHRAKERIRDVDNSLNYFVLTGQAKTYNSEEFKNAFPYVFSKGVDEDEDRLFEMLVESCKNRELTRWKQRYPEIFEVCTERYIGEKHFSTVKTLIKDLENPDDIYDAKNALNPMRKIIEACFAKLNAIGIVPDEIHQNQGNINGTSIFLSGKHKEYECNENLIHPVIAHNIHRLLNITQAGSHNEGTSLDVDNYMAKTSNSYLYRSTIFMLLDTIAYLRAYIDEHPDKQANQQKWRKISINVSSETEQSTEADSGHWIYGEVIRIKPNDWGEFKSPESSEIIGIPPSMVSENNLEKGQSVAITTRPSPDNKKTFINEIKAIN